MSKNVNNTVDEVRVRLIEVAGRTTQDLGLGRILGQVLCHVYLSENECSLDDIGLDLGLSKAAVSIASRQLEALGVLQRAWKKGDRKNYYRTANNFGSALQHGLLDMVRGKIRTIGAELDNAEDMLAGVTENTVGSDTRILRKRIQRAKKLRKRAMQILDNPILKMLGR